MDTGYDVIDTLQVSMDAPDTVTCQARNAVFIDEREVRWIGEEAVYWAACGERRERPALFHAASLLQH